MDALTYQPPAGSLAAELNAAAPLEPWMRLPRGGFLALGKAAGAAWTDRYFHVRAMDNLRDAAKPGQHDLYVTQATFQKRDKSGENLGLGLLAHVDLDLYASPEMAGDYTMSQVIARVLAACDDASPPIPRPSYLVFSGRGIAAKWVLSAAVPRRALPRLRAINVELATRLSDLGADRRAVDCSRVLRVLGSVNSKSGATVRVISAFETLAGTLRVYDLDELAGAVLPKSSTEFRQDRAAARAARPRPLNPDHLEWLRERAAARGPRQRGAFPAEWPKLVLSDLETLVSARWGGTCPEGHRNTLAMLAGCALGQIVPPDALELAWSAWIDRFLPAGYSECAEFKRLVKSLLRRARRTADGETVEYGGVECPPLYTPRKSTIMALLGGLAPDEQQCMRALIDKPEKERRRREGRRTSRKRSDRPDSNVTGMDRGAWRQERAAMALRARQLRETGLDWSQVAAALGDGYSAEAARKLASRAPAA